MSMTYTLNDGRTVEFGIGDAYPPGHVGQHTNCNRVWYRFPGGEWQPSECRSQVKELERLNAEVIPEA